MLGHSSNNKCVCRNNLDWASGWGGGDRKSLGTNRQSTATWLSGVFCFSWWQVYKAHLGLFGQQIRFPTAALSLASGGLTHAYLTISLSVTGVLTVLTSRVTTAHALLTRDFLCFLLKV